MSKTKHPRPPSARNLEAMVMIVSGKGRAQYFKDKRDKRSKDARRKREAFGEGEW
jgi:hypothetical protein